MARRKRSLVANGIHRRRGSSLATKYPDLMIVVNETIAQIPPLHVGPVTVAAARFLVEPPRRRLAIPRPSRGIPERL